MRQIPVHQLQALRITRHILRMPGQIGFLYIAADEAGAWPLSFAQGKRHDVRGVDNPAEVVAAGVGDDICHFPIRDVGIP